MRERITNKDLEKLTGYLNKEMPGADLSVDRNVGGFCVVRKDGRHMSHRGTRRGCYDYLHAILDGVDLYERFVVGDVIA
tara:strand:- start:11001 stop:11237 length:237 start_codon:yes stop_codon:yes gene_type:complete